MARSAVRSGSASSADQGQYSHSALPPSPTASVHRAPGKAMSRRQPSASPGGRTSRPTPARPSATRRSSSPGAVRIGKAGGCSRRVVLPVITAAEDGQVGEHGSRHLVRVGGLLWPGAGSATRSRCRPRSRSRVSGRRLGLGLAGNREPGDDLGGLAPCCGRCSGRRPEPSSSAVTSTYGPPGSPVTLKTAGSRPGGKRTWYPCSSSRAASARAAAPVAALGNAAARWSAMARRRAGSEGRGGRIGEQAAEGVRLAEDHRQQRRAGHADRVSELQELADVVDALPTAGPSQYQITLSESPVPARPSSRRNSPAAAER